MNPQRGSDKVQQRRRIRQPHAGKIAGTREVIRAIRRLRLRSAVHPDPVIQPLQHHVQVLIRLQLHHSQPAVAIHREQIQHAAIARREGRHLPVDRRRKQRMFHIRQRSR